MTYEGANAGRRGGSDAGGQCRERLVLGRVARSLPVVRLPAWVGQIAAVDRVVPLVCPVTVPVRADAIRALPRLPVLAPQAVSGLRVDKACGGARWLVNN